MAIQDGTLLIFGIDTPNKGYGLVQSYDDTSTVKRATAIAPDGAIVSIQEYGAERNLTLTFLPLSNGSTDPSDPEIGTPFIFAGSTWFVDSISDSRSVDGFATKIIEGTTYAGVF